MRVVWMCRVFMCAGGTCGERGCATSEMPLAQSARPARRPIWAANSGRNSPHQDTLTPTFSNRRPRAPRRRRPRAGPTAGARSAGRQPLALRPAVIALELFERGAHAITQRLEPGSRALAQIGQVRSVSSCPIPSMHPSVVETDVLMKRPAKATGRHLGAGGEAAGLAERLAEHDGERRDHVERAPALRHGHAHTRPPTAPCPARRCSRARPAGRRLRDTRQRGAGARRGGQKHQPAAAGAPPRLERRPGREALDRRVAQIVEADPAQPPLIPHETAWLDDQSGTSSTRRDAWRPRWPRCRVGTGRCAWLLAQDLRFLRQYAPLCQHPCALGEALLDVLHGGMATGERWPWPRWQLRMSGSKTRGRVATFSTC